MCRISNSRGKYEWLWILPHVSRGPQQGKRDADLATQAEELAQAKYQIDDLQSRLKVQ